MQEIEIPATICDLHGCLHLSIPKETFGKMNKLLNNQGYIFKVVPNLKESVKNLTYNDCCEFQLLMKQVYSIQGMILPEGENPAYGLKTLLEKYIQGL